MDIYYSSKFAREYKKLSLTVKKHAEAAEKIFRKNPFSEKLRTHKLGGKLKNYRAFSINSKCRIIFEFYKKDVVWFHSIGDHSIYK